MLSLAFLLAANPLLLWGAALIGVPILIHILNKRRFKIVQWAAMDLLMQVERRNRRRLKLEDWLILLLRCLAVLLLVLLVAGLVFDPRGLGLGQVKGGVTERVVILDDSPSMGQSLGNRTLWDASLNDLADGVRRLARERSGDRLTLILTSRPRLPVYNGQLLTSDNAEQVARAISGLPLAGTPAAFAEVFLAAEDWLPVAPNAASERLLYILSDFREVDWQSAKAGGEGQGALARLAELATRVQRLVLCDLGHDLADDVAIGDLQAVEPNLVSGVATRFSLTVTNHGTNEARAVAVTLASSLGEAVQRELGPLAPGASITELIPVQFATPGPVLLTASLGQGDAGAFNNQRYLAGEVAPGLAVLVVDGEPDLDTQRAESFYLRTALAPPGERASGLQVTVVDEGGLAEAYLPDYRVIFLCNVFRPVAEQLVALQAWVARGGVLVLAPGDLVDASTWNSELAASAPELALLRFGDLIGAANEESWQTLRLQRGDHPLLAVFAGDQNPLLQRLKFYQYWQLLPQAGRSETLAAFNDGDPALVLGRVGLGQVLWLAMPVDAEWSNWPANPSFVVTVQQIVQQLARPPAQASTLAVGQPLWYPLDTTRYRPTATLFRPASESGEALSAQSPPKGEGVGLAWPALDQMGGWRLLLQEHEGEAVTVPLAANIAAAESQPARAPSKAVLAALGEAPVSWVTGIALSAADDGAGKQSLARTCGFLALLVLMLEQVLAWAFTMRRQRP